VDALVGGFVVVDEQGLVEQEAPGRAVAGNARRRPLERGPAQLVAGRLQTLGDAGQLRAAGGVGDRLPEPGQPLGVESMAPRPDPEELRGQPGDSGGNPSNSWSNLMATPRSQEAASLARPGRWPGGCG
jgi:hypothetical protein